MGTTTKTAKKKAAKKKAAKNTGPLAQNGEPQGHSPPAANAAAATWTAPFSNYAGDIPLTIDPICDSLLAMTGGWPKCVSGALCYFQGGEAQVLEDAAALFAWVGSYGPVEWRRGARAVTKEELFKRLRQRDRWQWATPHPHFPPVPDVYYLEAAPTAKNNGKLDELVGKFLPKTPRDRQLIKALILTLFWGGPPGKRPQFVIAADEAEDRDAGRGTGKSTLPQYLGELVGGCIDLDHAGNRDRIGNILLSPSSWSRRVVLLDNLKTARFSNDYLEKLVTRTEITGHRLFHGFAARPNLLIWVITVNGAYFSTDGAQRSIVIYLDRPPKNAGTWDETTLAFIRHNRQAIIADVRWHLEVKQRAAMKEVGRWGPWCQGVLSTCAKPNKLWEAITGRADAIDADKEEVEVALGHLRSCIICHFDEEGPAKVDTSVFWAPTAWLVHAVRGLKRDLTDRLAQQFLGRLSASGRLRKHDTNTQRGYFYIGPYVDPEDPPPPKHIAYRPEIPGVQKKSR
jgi:hypothetical protein